MTNLIKSDACVPLRTHGNQCHVGVSAFHASFQEPVQTPLPETFPGAQLVSMRPILIK